MKILKNKILLIFLGVFLVLFFSIQAFMPQNDDFEELESKFPLEDYLFADSKEKREIEELKKKLEEKEKQEQAQNNFTQIDDNLKNILERLEKEKNKQTSLYKDLYDEKGNPIELDQNGEPLLYTQEGKRVFLDENGNPYYTDEDGNKVYIGSETPIYTDKGAEIKRDEAGNLIFKDKDNNNVIINENKKTTYDKDGNQIITDKNGNYTKIDKDGKIVERGKRDPFGEEGEKNTNSNNSNNKTTNTTTTIENTNKEHKEYKEPIKDETKYLYDENGNIIGDSVAVENQKFDPKKANDKQKTINNILASRFETKEKEEKKKEIEYGVNEFTNLDEKDEGSNEHKLLRTITADRMIPAFLVRPISSQLGGNIVAQVETNIYGAMGRVVLIPKGSRVIGFYQANNKIGEYRLDIIWTRIITPHGINILLTNAKGADVKGYNGLVGEVHSRNFQKYGIPLSLSTLSNGLLLAINSMNQSATADNTNTTNQITSAYMTAQIMSGMRQDVSTIIQRIVQEQIKIQPIITIREGSRIFIAPSQDIFIPIPKKGETLAKFFNEEKQVQSNEEENTQEEMSEEDDM